MDKLIKVNLWDMIGVSLILPCNSNIEYFNQVGGTACLQKSEQGILIPFNNDYSEDSFEDSFEFKLSEIFSGYTNLYLTQEIVERLNSFFCENDQLGKLAVNESRTQESCESWIYVNISRELNSVFNSDITRGVLTWPNSD